MGSSLINSDIRIRSFSGIGDIIRVTEAHYLGIGNQDRMRCKGFKIKMSRFKKEMGRYWFSNTVADEWNGLSNQVVSAKTIERFKRRLHKDMDGDDGWK